MANFYNTDKSAQLIFVLRQGDCPSVNIKRETILHKDSYKYLGLQLKPRLTWKYHIRAKRIRLDIKTRKLYWIFEPNYNLNIRSQVMLYKTD